MRKLKYLIIPAVTILTPPAFSQDNYALIVHGLSIHSNCDEGNGPKAKTCDFENYNPGLGLEWSVLGNHDSGTLSLRGGIYRDSYSDTATYAGANYRKLWNVYSDWQAGLGLMAGYLNGSGVDGFAMLPYGIIAYNRLSLEIGYAPKTDIVPEKKHSTVTSFTLRWQF